MIMSSLGHKLKPIAALSAAPSGDGLLCHLRVISLTLPLLHMTLSCCTTAGHTNFVALVLLCVIEEDLK